MNRRLAILLNSIIAVLEVIGLIVAFTVNQWKLFVFYTQLSNIVLLVASVCCVVWLLKNKEEKPVYPRKLTILKYMATAVVTVTLVIVVTVLVPMCIPYGPATMLRILCGEASLYHHILCPILAIVTFLGCEKMRPIGLTENLWATLPTLGYAIVTTTLNVLRVMRGPYPFLYVYEQPVWMSVMWFCLIPGVGYMLAYILRRCKNRIEIKNN